MIFRGKIVVLVLGVLGAPLLSSASARGERFAVLPVDAARDGGDLPVKAAMALRAALQQQGITVLDVKATRGVIEQHLQRGGTDLATYKKRLEQSEQALAALDQERSISILETLIADLAVDPDFSQEKQALLETARLKLASRLIGLAGGRESGKAETPYGQRARGLLVDALRANPKMAPSRDEYPPRFHVLLDGARAELNKLGTGGLTIDSRPRGATVFIEGRDVGRTPLALGGDVLARGSYRMWVEGSGARSVPQVIRVDATNPKIFVDLAFEGSLWIDGPGLRPLEGRAIDDEVARKIGRFLGVDTLLLVGRWSYEGDDDYLWGAAFSVAEGEKERHGVVRLDESQSVDLAATGLASFLGRGERRGIESRPLPPTVLPDEPAPASRAGQVTAGGQTPGAASSSNEELPWGTIGIAGATAAGVLLVGAAVGVGIMLAPKDGAAVITVEDL